MNFKRGKYVILRSLGVYMKFPLILIARDQIRSGLPYLKWMENPDQIGTIG